MNKLKESLDDNIIFILFSKPGLYLKKLVFRTILIGVAIYLTGLAIHWLDLDSFKVPSSMHSLIGIVIGLLLVFRTNTAYDRWWDGRKTIALLANEIGVISARLGVIKNDNNKHTISLIKNNVALFVETLKKYLTVGKDGKQSNLFHISQKKAVEEILKVINQLPQEDINVGGINNSVCKLLEYSNTLERIKNTPIPLSYAIHIKISILIYLLSLPFGLFHELGVWATPFVMVVYYIIAGVEIISNEIENPFAGDPNDLPMDILFSNIHDALMDE